MKKYNAPIAWRLVLEDKTRRLRHNDFIFQGYFGLDAKTEVNVILLRVGSLRLFNFMKTLARMEFIDNDHQFTELYLHQAKYAFDIIVDNVK